MLYEREGGVYDLAMAGLGPYDNTFLMVETRLILVGGWISAYR